jgi:hypothetical protein
MIPSDNIMVNLIIELLIICGIALGFAAWIFLYKHKK